MDRIVEQYTLADVTIWDEDTNYHTKRVWLDTKGVKEGDYVSYLYEDAHTASPRFQYDSKTILQEVVQGHYEEPLHYELIGEEGPDHDKRFLVEAVIGNTTIGEGSGHTKKAAEQEAAYQALLWMKERGLYVS